MLLNNFSSHYTPNSTTPNTSDNITNSSNTNNTNNRSRSSSNSLSRLFNQSCCPNDNNNDQCYPNRGISLSTILFFVLIFLILFYND